MYVQEFSAPWPEVLHEMHEYLVLTHLSLAGNARSSVRVVLSKGKVNPQQLQPAVNEFRRRLHASLPGLVLRIEADTINAHRVEVRLVI